MANEQIVDQLKRVGGYNAPVTLIGLEKVIQEALNRLADQLQVDLDELDRRISGIEKLVTVPNPAGPLPVAELQSGQWPRSKDWVTP